MIYWFGIFLILFTTILISELGYFPYYSYFENNTFWIRSHWFWKKTLDLKNVISANLVLKSVDDGYIHTIQLWTTDKIYNVRTVGIFCYKSNVELLNVIKNKYPNIDMNSKQISKYLEAKNHKGFYVIDEHLGAYILLTITFIFTLYFLYRYIVG